MILALLLAQLAASILLLVRLAAGRHRLPPVQPVPGGLTHTSVSVLVATLNEAQRLGPCLEGLRAQGAPLREVIVVDSRSPDGTADLVHAMAARDPRFSVVNDTPVPDDWIGKVWALQHGLGLATGEWVLGLDADIDPQPGMVAGVVAAADALGLDVASFSPRFAGMTRAEQWVQPSMLVTLVYRLGAAGAVSPPPDRMMANGQCFLARRSTLLAHGGYEIARASWADDVTLARELARRGVRVGFLDGSRLYEVRSYSGLADMWREWGRSFDLSDATSRVRQWWDVVFIWLVQGTPILVLLAFALDAVDGTTPIARAWMALNGGLVFVRALLLLALRGSYRRRTLGFWLSPLTDPAAAWRLMLSSARRPRGWRGRAYALGGDDVRRAGARPGEEHA
ncbi:MAG: glycosyltransferase family A protein [Gemmatimonadaceae bacterium]